MGVQYAGPVSRRAIHARGGVLQVRKVSPNIATEVYFWGCNPSFVSTIDGVFMIDTPQQPIDAVRWKERLTEAYPGPIRYLVNTEPHIDHISGNAYFPGVEVIGHVGLQARYEQAMPQMTSPERVEMIKQADPDSVWLMNRLAGVARGRRPDWRQRLSSVQDLHSRSRSMAMAGCAQTHRSLRHRGHRAGARRTLRQSVSADPGSDH